MASKKEQSKKGVNPFLEESINKLLDQVMEDVEASLTDKMKVIDRAINLEKIKQKITEEEWGSAFAEEDE